MRRWTRPLLAALSAAGLVAAASVAAPAGATAAAPRHVFVINLENKGYAETFGPASAAPYLARTLVSQGALLEQYYGIAHNSLPNYLAQISGQAPNIVTQADCPVYLPLIGIGAVPPQQALGQGCVYPPQVKTVADQLAAKGLTWGGYMEDMGNDPAREAASCGHPALGAADPTQKATPTDGYAARHDPFVYFKSITFSSSCAANVKPLTALPAALSSAATTPNLTYITPNLCNDGHDAPCADGRPGGLPAIDTWLRTWVPKILASPAFGADGVLVVTFDESDGPTTDSSGCCGRTLAPNTPLPGITGFGGGRVGAVVLSRFVQPGTVSSVGYDHYSLLATIEDTFGLPRLGYAQQAKAFGPDVFAAR
jgi:hypothetical protein